jgi:hypothetical protein
MLRDEIEAFIRTFADESALLAEGFDEAFCGVAIQFNKTFAVYDAEKCHRILMERDGMDSDEADEWMSFNVLGAYVGDSTPAFFTAFQREET